jgi:hypothetical protein
MPDLAEYAQMIDKHSVAPSIGAGVAGLGMPDMSLGLMGHEELPFREWAGNNNVLNPFDPRHYYDFVSAWRARTNRGVNLPSGESGHFPDTYKMEGHPGYSWQSQYWQPGQKAGTWIDPQGGYVSPESKYYPFEQFKYIPFNQQLIDKTTLQKNLSDIEPVTGPIMLAKNLMGT